jgi:hypothetical protein
MLEVGTSWGWDFYGGQVRVGLKGEDANRGTVYSGHIVYTLWYINLLKRRGICHGRR